MKVGQILATGRFLLVWSGQWGPGSALAVPVLRAHGAGSAQQIHTRSAQGNQGLLQATLHLDCSFKMHF